MFVKHLKKTLLEESLLKSIRGGRRNSLVGLGSQQFDEAISQTQTFLEDSLNQSAQYVRNQVQGFGFSDLKQLEFIFDDSRKLNLLQRVATELSD
jgi:hypothetical protein